MAVIYVARSAKFSKWGSDVGVGKNIFKVGVAEDAELKDLVTTGWAGETDWQLVKKQALEDMDEEAVLARLGRKLKMLDPTYYPKLKSQPGFFRATPEQVENHQLVSRALANAAQLVVAKPKPADFADFLIHNATR